MSLPTFTDLLRTAVAAMQAAHPERLGEIGRAHAAIVEGHVVPVDADNGQVLSRNGSTWYATNGSCNCTAGSFGKPCRHLQAWKLFRHIQKQHAALQVTASALLPEAPPVEPEPATPPPPALPEAPASANVHLIIDGRQVQLTLRDIDEGRLLQRLQTVLEQYPAPAPTARPEGWCPIHNMQMKETTKDGRSWWSHRHEGQWCKGKGGRS